MPVTRRFRRSSWASLLAGAYGLVATIALLRWAGLPRVETSLFALGAASVIGTLLGLAVLGWFLFRRPVRGGVATSAPILATHQRRALALLLAVSGLLIVVGGYWDEVWH